MKMGLELPSGLRITFEGEGDEFESFTAFLADVPAFVETLGLPDDEEEEPGELPPGDVNNSGNPMAPRAVAERMQAVGATSDIERVAVLAQLAVEAGRPGIDATTADDLYEELGYPKPPRWSRTFFNAKQRNFVRSAGRGVWRPTVHGENFARLGRRPPGFPRPRAAMRDRPRLALDDGESGDD